MPTAVIRSGGGIRTDGTDEYYLSLCDYSYQQGQYPDELSTSYQYVASPQIEMKNTLNINKEFLICDYANGIRISFEEVDKFKVVWGAVIAQNYDFFCFSDDFVFDKYLSRYGDYIVNDYKTYNGTLNHVIGFLSVLNFYFKLEAI